MYIHIHMYILIFIDSDPTGPTAAMNLPLHASVEDKQPKTPQTPLHLAFVAFIRNLYAG